MCAKNKQELQKQSLTTDRPITRWCPSNGNLGTQLSMTLYGMEYPIGQSGSSVLAALPPNTLSTINLLVGEGRVRSREDLDTRQALLSNS